MGLRYTESEDGVIRASIRLTIRLTVEEIEQTKQLAKDSGEDWRTWLEGHASLGIEGELVDYDGGSYAQRYGEPPSCPD